jgi:hypothetical protein
MVVASLAYATGARGWGTHEHEEIGTEGYRRACAMLERESAARASADPGRDARMRVACGQVAVSSHVYGQASSLGGDNFASPNDFFTAAGVGKVWSRVHHALLARVNSEHFHPFAARFWREYHWNAIEHAVAAAQLEGIPMVERFERAFFESAFADHHLQDGFAAGHMGFNRPASSAGAALVFHNMWNARGRMVHNRKGEAWLTLGDNLLDDPRNAAGKQHLLDTETASIFVVLASFVDGARRPGEELAVIESWPFTIEAPTAPELLEEAFSSDHAGPPPQESLAAVFARARKDFIADGGYFVSGSFAHGDPTLSGFEATVGLAIPLLPYDTYLSAGVAGPAGDQTGHALLGVGFRIPCFLTNDGILSHEVDIGIDWNVTLSDFFATVHGAYRLNLEAGAFLIKAMAGPSVVFPSGDIGYYGHLGVGWVFTAAGGGVP